MADGRYYNTESLNYNYSECCKKKKKSVEYHLAVSV